MVIKIVQTFFWIFVGILAAVGALTLIGCLYDHWLYLRREKRRKVVNDIVEDIRKLKATEFDYLKDYDKGYSDALADVFNILEQYRFH